MEIEENIEIIDGYPALYLKDIDLLVISDLQIGFEIHLAQKGILIPQFQFEEILNDIKKIKAISRAKRILINGDLKHEFKEVTKQEWRETIEFLNFCKENFKEVIIVRGNHDNYLLNILKEFEITFYDPYYLEKDYCFLHGHKKIEIPNCKYLIIGHEQPAIVLRNEFEKVKLKTFLFGKYKDIKLIVLPSFSSISFGSEINNYLAKDFLSPYLKESEIDDFEVYAIDKTVGTLKLGKLKNLRYF
ncbi:MAG: metallophosphoesterase [Candidatus Aenigmarchaeota archaeon]|nr:metallophosphoesterase [Candidatus Aenigmarchaeota archaeon]